MRRLRSIAAVGFVLVIVAVAAGSSSGCYTEYEVRPAECRAVWVPGHYGPFGRWR